MSAGEVPLHHLDSGELQACKQRRGSITLMFEKDHWMEVQGAGWISQGQNRGDWLKGDDVTGERPFCLLLYSCSPLGIREGNKLEMRPPPCTPLLRGQ